MRVIFIDTETTGLSPNYGHRIIEIGCIASVRLSPISPISHFHHYIHPQRNVPDDATQIHGITNAFLADKPRFEEIAPAFLRFIGEAVLVIHNAPFDMRFINFELDKIGHPSISMRRVRDTLPMARRKLPELRSHTLDALCQYFGIDNSARNLHGALSDAQLLAKVYQHLVGR